MWPAIWRIRTARIASAPLAAFEAVRRYREGGGKLEVWLYRGAWQEFEPHQIERAGSAFAS